ncbi:hypothetical protein PR048_022626 [Dryococelus australis]|uniref:Uncharacterized protein n=1 Tax=Dryococelus australis TaxID=614101 RepID=A0ABQ9H1G5_9NEOP|nr:hypothetical protein PR048_022626 [Dryococelus australis]
MYADCKAEVELLLQKAEYLSITIDFWISTTNDGYMSLTVHIIDNNSKPHHLCIGVVLFIEILHNVENISYIKNMVTNCKRIVGHYKHSSQAYKILEIAQKKLNLP